MRPVRSLARGWAAAAVLAALGAGGWAPGQALAGEYTINTCASPDETPQPISATFINGYKSFNTDDCTDPDLALHGLQLVLPGHAFTGTEFNDFGVTATVPASAPNLGILWTHARFSLAPENGTGTSGNFLVTDATKVRNVGTPVTWAADYAGFKLRDFSSTFSPAARQVKWSVSCFGACAFAGTPADLTLHRLETHLIDPRPPLAPEFVPLGLLDGTPQRGARTITLTGVDEDSGVNHVDVGTGSALLGRAGQDRCSYTEPVVCPQRSALAFPIDTAKLPEGSQTLEVSTVDGSGEVTTVRTPAFVVDNIPDVSGSAGTPAAQFATQLKRGAGHGKHAVVGRLLQLSVSGLRPGAKLSITCNGRCPTGLGRSATASKTGRVKLRFKHPVVVKRSTRVTLTATFAGTTPGQRTVRFVTKSSGLFARTVK